MNSTSSPRFSNSISSTWATLDSTSRHEYLDVSLKQIRAGLFLKALHESGELPGIPQNWHGTIEIYNPNFITHPDHFTFKATIEEEDTTIYFYSVKIDSLLNEWEITKAWRIHSGINEPIGLPKPAALTIANEQSALEYQSSFEDFGYDDENFKSIMENILDSLSTLDSLSNIESH